MKKAVKKLLEEHDNLIHSEDMKVTSHVQREDGEWIINTLMLADNHVAFKYKRKKMYKNLTDRKVNVTYYPEKEEIAGLEIEIMKVVRIKLA